MCFEWIGQRRPASHELAPEHSPQNDDLTQRVGQFSCLLVGQFLMLVDNVESVCEREREQRIELESDLRL